MHTIAFLKNEFCSYGYFTSSLPAKFGYLKSKRYRRLFDLMGGDKTSPFSIYGYFSCPQKHQHSELAICCLVETNAITNH